MSTNRIIGKYEYKESGKIDFKMKISFCADDFKKEWTRCNYTANYIAEYSAYNFDPGDKAENLISTVINELVERLALISEKKARLSVSLALEDDILIVDVENRISADKRDMYEKTVARINNENIDKLYMDNITANPVEEENEFEFGLVMLVNDYRCRIGSLIVDGGTAVTRLIIDNEEVKK